MFFGEREPNFRFLVLRHEKRNRRARAEMRLNGIDPDDNYSLIWSFRDRVNAERQMASDQEVFKEPIWTFHIVDCEENGREYVK
jgi:hypothetical protein